jgi:hypothetical protein
LNEGFCRLAAGAAAPAALRRRRTNCRMPKRERGESRGDLSIEIVDGATRPALVDRQRKSFFIFVVDISCNGSQ